MDHHAADALLGAPAAHRAVVVGGPGSGKTTLLIERVKRLVEAGVAPDQVVVLTPSRSAASFLRDRVGLELGRATQGPRVRSLASLAFGIVQAAHAEGGIPAPDVLSASEIDSDIEALLRGHEEDGGGPAWPDPLTPLVRQTTAFRGELRDWMARATEAGLTPQDVRAIATEHPRPRWVAAADFWEEFRMVVASGRPGSLDSAELVRRAAFLVRQSCPEPFERLVHVCVDDAVDLTSAGYDLIHALAERGVGVTIAGDPDVAGNTFRGSNPASMSQVAAEWGVQPLVLSRLWRYGDALRALALDVAGRIGTAGLGGQRSATAAPGLATEVFSLEAGSSWREANDIARLIVRAHRDQGVALGDVAIIARRTQSVSYLAGELARAGIPTRMSHTAIPLRDQPAAKELLEILALGRGVLELTPERAVAVLTGRYAQMSHHDLRRLRFYLRVAADQDGPYRGADALLADALGHRGGFSGVPPTIARRAEVLATLLDDVARAPAATPVNELLWLALDQTGVVARWQRQATEAGPRQAAANRSLDSLLALFSHAAEWVDDHPGASLDVYLEDVLRQAVPDDVLVPEAGWDSVLVATPAQAAGREFRFVVVAGVDEGVWPDVRLRGSLLAAHQLSAGARGELGLPVDERKIIRDDELRMFLLAITRARETLVVTAIASEDVQPSPLFRIVQAHSTGLASDTEPPESLRQVIGRLRRELATHPGAKAPAHDLALLARSGAPGADPRSWWGLLPPSSTAPLFHEREVPVSPSRIETIEESPVEWFLDAIAQADTSSQRGLGVLIHHALETHPDGDESALWAEVEARFDQLDYDAGWIEAYHRRLARGMVGALADYLADRRREGSSLVGTEVPFDIRHGRAVVRGSIDRLERDHTGSLVVVDLKTGTHQTDSAVVDNPQMLSYQLGVLTEGLREHYGLGDDPLGGAVLLFVKSGVRGKRYRLATQEPVTPERVEETLRRFERAAELIAQDQFAGGPRVFGDSTRRSRHRWHFVGQVCGDA